MHTPAAPVPHTRVRLHIASHCILMQQNANFPRALEVCKPWCTGQSQRLANQPYEVRVSDGGKRAFREPREILVSKGCCVLVVDGWPRFQQPHPTASLGRTIRTVAGAVRAAQETSTSRRQSISFIAALGQYRLLGPLGKGKTTESLKRKQQRFPVSNTISFV